MMGVPEPSAVERQPSSVDASAGGLLPGSSRDEQTRQGRPSKSQITPPHSRPLTSEFRLSSSKGGGYGCSASGSHYTASELPCLNAEDLVGRLVIDCGGRLGGGASSRAYKATFDGQPAAIKVIHPSHAQRESNVHLFYKEAHFLYRCHHRYGWGR